MFPQTLKQLRTQKGLSQESLAARLHVVRQTVSKWEQGRSVPDADLLLRLAEVLETPVEALLGATHQPLSDTAAIALHLETLATTLAERSRRGRRIWRIIGIVLLSLLLLSAALALAGQISYRNVTAESVAVLDPEEPTHP